MTAIPASAPRRALILAPHGRDAGVAAALLDSAAIHAAICVDWRDLENRLDEEANFVVVTEEALRFADLQGIARRLSDQPPWSDLPFIILTRRAPDSERRSDAKAFHGVFGNVAFLERPFHSTTFISLARTALRSRQRQLEARTRMEQLHEGSERLRTALLAGRLGSWELDLTTRTLTVSAPCKALFGRTADQTFTYVDMLESIHPDDRAAVRKNVRVTLRTGADFAVECRSVWPDGNIHWADIRARLVRDRTGQHARLVGVSSDITERKSSQDGLRKLNEVLEERVSERTAALTAAHATVLAEIEQRERAEEQLRQAQKMEMMGQLTGGIAHDFNNLLMAVLGNLDVLRKHVPPDAKTTRLIEGAMQGAQRGAALTQRLLAFARRQELKVEPGNLAALVRGATDLIERSAGEEIALRLDLPEDLPLALMDANQIELAVLNLVVNARDAMPHGGVLSIAVDHLHARAAADLPAGHYVRLVVGDTGEGMDAVTLRKATEPFFSTKELGKGTGLGLSMVHGLAEQLGGALRMTSEVGRGTQVELWLPVTAIAPEEQMAAATQAEQDVAERISILVVDDDALIAMSTVDMLEDLGHHVIEAGSADRALEILRGDRPIDLLVTDYAMPRMNGAELAAAARKVRPDLPVLLASGYAELPDGTGDGLPRIGKPYQQEQLSAKITAVLSRHRRHRTSH